MRKYILIYRTNVKRAECLPALYDDGREALGAALVELDRLMREAGFNGRYTLYPPYRAGDSVNLTAVSERTNGYPQAVAIDIYVQPVIIDEDIQQDFMEVTKP
jgi:hypothetical protein